MNLTLSINLGTFGLPKCLHIPIAAANVEGLETCVGKVLARRVSRSGRKNAVLPASHPALPPGWVNFTRSQVGQIYLLWVSEGDRAISSRAMIA